MTISCNDSEFASEQKQTRKKVVKPTADAEPEQEKPTLTDQDIPPLGEEGNQVTIDPPKVAIEEGDQEPALAEPEIEQVDSLEPLEEEERAKSVTLKYLENAAPVVDYLFVVDNSVSMKSILKHTQAGFLSIAEEGVFPNKARIGVMSTATPEVKTATGKQAGYLSLVTKESIAAGSRSTKATHPGCGAWFEPNEKDAMGQSCLVSATQFNLPATGYEAGMTALELMLRNQAQPLFRKGALVNVIFVSDTHDPGAGNNRELQAKADAHSYEKFKELVDRGNEVSSLKFHAIAPLTARCSAEGTYDFSYLRLVDASSGEKESCDLNDYKEFIGRMVEASKMAENLPFGLPDDVKQVVSVHVGDESFPFSVDDDGKVLTVEGLGERDLDSYDIKVRYLY